MRRIFTERVHGTASIRLQAASILLAAVVALPLYATTSVGSVETNLLTAYLQLGFIGLLIPEMAREARFSLTSSPTLRLATFLLLITIVGWMLNFIPLSERSRSIVYAVQPFFLAAAIGWFRAVEGRGLRFIFWVKLLSVLGALLVLAHFLAILPESASKLAIKSDPPIYRHLRHLNYDLAMIFALSFIYWVAYSRLSQSLNLSLFALLGFVSVWSAGRGQFLSMGVFLFLVLAFRVKSPLEPALRKPLLAFLAGGAAVFLTDATYLLNNTWEYSSDLGSLNRVSASRLHIWAQSLQQVGHSWMFGFGPDGFLHWWITASSANLVQPHNFIVQWLMEFGVIGTAGLMLCLGSLMLLCIRILRRRHEDTPTAIIAALLISTVAFALVDGNFYHSIPLTMTLLLSAYVIVKSTEISTHGIQSKSA